MLVCSPSPPLPLSVYVHMCVRVNTQRPELFRCFLRRVPFYCSREGLLLNLDGFFFFSSLTSHCAPESCLSRAPTPCLRAGATGTLRYGWLSHGCQRYEPKQVINLPTRSSPCLLWRVLEMGLCWVTAGPGDTRSQFGKKSLPWNIWQLLGSLEGTQPGATYSEVAPLRPGCPHCRHVSSDAHWCCLVDNAVWNLGAKTCAIKGSRMLSLAVY